MISECDAMMTSNTNDALHSGYVYEYTVTPISKVQSASDANGESNNVTGVSYIHNKCGR